MKIHAAIFFSALTISGIVFAQTAQTINPREVAQKIYSQCMSMPDKNFAQQQKAYCRCTSENISKQMSAQEMASMAAGAGAGASQDEIGKTMMSDPRLIQIVSQCFSQALGDQATGGLAPSTPSGLVGKPFQ
ncbi:MAG TPA: hypothetical protein PKW15_02900 [Alphaproteobacteria bacterium]|nr:hypothetical protein [Rhodospirillaceae bacterium]HRJ12173.1 hypothetical protein [Alphaproteobacteria bacterium]